MGKHLSLKRSLISGLFSLCGQLLNKDRPLPFTAPSAARVINVSGFFR